MFVNLSVTQLTADSTVAGDVNPPDVITLGPLIGSAFSPHRFTKASS